VQHSAVSQTRSCRASTKAVDLVWNKQYSVTWPFGQNVHVSALGSASNVSYSVSGVIRDPPMNTSSNDHTDCIRPTRANKQTGYNTLCVESVRRWCTYTTTTPVERLLFQDNLSKLVPELYIQSGFKWGKILWSFGMQWHQLDYMQFMQTICTSLQYQSIFYRPGALPDAQPTCQSTEGECYGTG